MIPYLVLFIEIISLGLISAKLSNNIFNLLYRVVPSKQVAMVIYATIFFPGVLLHELSHFIFAAILLVPIGQVNLIPSIEEDKINLGHVTIGRVDPIRRALCGLAPLIIGVSSLVGLIMFLSNNLNLLPWWQIGLLVYLLFIISNSMFPSRQDWSGTIEFFLAIVIFLVLILTTLYFIGFKFTYSLPEFVTNQQTTDLIWKICALLLVPLVLNFVSLVIANIFKRKY